MLIIVIMIVFVLKYWFMQMHACVVSVVVFLWLEWKRDGPWTNVWCHWTSWNRGGCLPAAPGGGLRPDCSTDLAAGEVRIGGEHNIRVCFFIKFGSSFIDFCLKEIRTPSVIVPFPVEEATWLLLSLTPVISLLESRIYSITTIWGRCTEKWYRSL